MRVERQRQREREREGKDRYKKCKSWVKREFALEKLQGGESQGSKKGRWGHELYTVYININNYSCIMYTSVTNIWT